MKRTFTVKPKQNIRASYIPDMTERYPEGMDTRGYDPYLDDPDAPLITLRDRIEDYMEDEADGDYYTNVKVVQNGQVVYEGRHLQDIYDQAKRDGKLDERLDSSYWHDTDILFTLMRR